MRAGDNGLSDLSRTPKRAARTTPLPSWRPSPLRIRFGWLRSEPRGWLDDDFQASKSSILPMNRVIMGQAPTRIQGRLESNMSTVAHVARDRDMSATRSYCGPVIAMSRFLGLERPRHARNPGTEAPRIHVRSNPLVPCLYKDVDIRFDHNAVESRKLEAMALRSQYWRGRWTVNLKRTYRNLGAVGLRSGLILDPACRQGSKVFQSPWKSPSLGNSGTLIEALSRHQA